MGKIIQILVVILLTFSIAYADETGIKFISVDMQKNVLVSAMKSSGWESHLEKQPEDNLYYKYRSLSQVFSIHPEWVDSYYEFVFKSDKLIEINWYKKDGVLLQSGLKKVQIKL